MVLAKVVKSEKARVAEALEKTSAFDFDYYSRRYMKSPATAGEAAKHFAKYMHMDFRSPNKSFDAWTYAAQYPDVRKSNINAFVHYLGHGRKEGRSIAALSSPAYKKSYEISELCLSKQRIRNVKIAICVHLFYDDYLPFLKSRLHDFPFPHDLYVSCRSDEVALHVTDALREIVPGQLTVRVVPNRGRNIAPLFVEFGDALGAYDIVGHVHTKKSLYTGTEKRDWSNHLFAGVLGTPDYVEAILKTMLARPEVQLVSSECFYELPFWALHVLSNADEISKLCGRLDLRVGAMDFVDYPVGGMFWTRGSLFNRFRDLKLTYEDFDEEAGQTDGTFHHAVERVIGLICTEKNGVFLKYSPRYGLIYEDQDQWRHLYERQTFAELESAMQSSAVASFDLFDTLLVRNASEVEEAKLLMSEHFVHRDIEGFEDYRALRNAAELRAREKKNWQGDVGFLEIATAMVEMGSASMEEALGWLHNEAELDFDLFLRRDTIARLYARLIASGHRVIVVSDTFYNREYIEKVIDKLGIVQPSALYLSSETGMRKDRGDLWQYVAATEQGAICHVGDNMVSDVQNPTNCGISSFFVAKAADKAKLLGAMKADPPREMWKLVSRAVLSFGDHPYFS